MLYLYLKNISEIKVPSSEFRSNNILKKRAGTCLRTRLNKIKVRYQNAKIFKYNKSRECLAAKNVNVVIYKQHKLNKKKKY